METPAGRRVSATPRSAALVCRRCVQPVNVLGDAEWGPAVHASTERELGTDGHLVAPIDADVVRTAMARKAGARR
jgi:hypothetical protein